MKTKNTSRQKTLILAITLGLITSYTSATPVYAERIDDSKVFVGDTTIDGGDNDNAVYIYDKNQAVIEIQQGTLTLKNNGDYPTIAIDPESKLQFIGSDVVIERESSNSNGSLVWIGEGGHLDFSNDRTTISGYGSYGLLVENGSEVSSNALIISNRLENDSTEWNEGVDLASGSTFIGNGAVTIETTFGKQIKGIYADGAKLTFNDKLTILTSGNGNTTDNTGINLLNSDGNSVEFLGKDIDITVQGGKDGIGFYSTDDYNINVDGNLKIYVDCDGGNEGDQTGNAGLYMTEKSHFTGQTAEITVSGKKGVAIFGHSQENDGKSTIVFDDNVKVNAEYAVFADTTYNSKDVATVDLKKGFISEHDNSKISVNSNSRVDINSAGGGIVQFNGTMGVFQEGVITNKDANINFNMNNDDSYWNLTGNSRLNTLNIANGAKLDMTADGNKFSTLRVKTLNGDKNSENTINMDIDAATNKDNSDRVYVDGVHSGNHYITLNNVGANTDGAEGTVLVSVKDEQGTFEAKDGEGKLYWQKYTLNSKDSEDKKYNKDWYLEKVEIVDPGDKPTTGVDSVMSVNSLNYHTWRTENDKLLQRMGELRHNGEEEKGAWFRVKGSKIGYDGGFENKYTTYELGYDEVTKRTEDVVRYQGAALSYVDGKSSYNNGSGDNHGKSIGFYTTEQYSKGHYLDLVFKISNMDNDFKVFDTNGNKITGEYDNTGVSISAEYGRKNDLDHGWYIEPQAQLTLGYMGGADYETSNGISVDQSGIKSALGRIGFNIGKKIGEKGIVYAKANLLHEFGGGYDVEMRAADGSLTMSNTYNDTWFEYGVGVAMATSDNSHIYFDVERSTGSDFYKDWQWNAGMRWNF